MMLRSYLPTPPTDPGVWTLLQERSDRALWQWDRPLQGRTATTRFVIIHDPSRLDFEDFDEAEKMFEMLED